MNTVSRHGDRQDYGCPDWEDKIIALDLEIRDPPLSKLGHAQARALGPFLESMVSSAKTVEAFSSPYVRVIQTAVPFIEATGLELRIEEGLAETRHSPGCVATPRERFAYYPLIETSHENMYTVENTEGAEWRHKKSGQTRPCEDYPYGYMKRMTEVAPLLEARVESLGPGGCAVCFSHAASVALAASLLKSSIEDIGKLAPVGIIRLVKKEAGSPWSLQRQGADNSDYIPPEQQSTKTFPWTFTDEARIWWTENIQSQWQ